MRRLRTILVLLIGAVGCATPGPTRGGPASRPVSAPPVVERIDRALSRAAAFLVSRQSPDGSWRSEHYGGFKDGYSLTPIVASSLYFLPPASQVDVRKNYLRASDFLATLTSTDTLPNYPVYGPAGAVLVLSSPQNERHEAVRDELVQYLLTRQLVEAHGWRESDASFGGWGYFRGRLKRPAGNALVSELLSSNLSATLFALGALAMADVPLSNPAFAKARTFVERCQNFPKDGGFFFTPANDLQNKAMHDDHELPRGRLPHGVTPRGGVVNRVYRSYGSMTADGVRALLRLGVPVSDPRVQAAKKWLMANFDPEAASGNYPESREQQRRSVYFYYAWTTAHAFVRLGVTELDWAERLSKAILQRQNDDGSWTNNATDLREDDPLLATPFAMAALELSRMVLTGKWTALSP